MFRDLVIEDSKYFPLTQISALSLKKHILQIIANVMI
jgi:hypothetical protein